MGYYIERTTDGRPLPAKGKADVLIADGGVEVAHPQWHEWSELVCVVDNGAFEAAGWAYSQDEFNAFNDPRDKRPKRWIRYPGVRTVLAHIWDEYYDGRDLQ